MATASLPTDSGPAEEDLFTETVERILSAAEGREGHLIEQDLDALTQLCTNQAGQRTLNGPLGFADVDVSWTGQLMAGLQRLVTIASTVDFVQAGYQGIQACKQGDETDRFEKVRTEYRYWNEIEFCGGTLTSPTLPSRPRQWMEKKGRPLTQTLSMGLEAAAILLFIMNSPGIDRAVISDDAIEASIVLFRHHLSKNMLPSINQVGHITAALEGGDKTQSAQTTLLTSAKKRRRTSASSDDQSLVRAMKKIYAPIRSTVGLTVQIMERLEALVRKVPLDDQPLLNISSGAFFSLEFDPAVSADVAVATQIHEAAIALITSIFRKYPRHRHILIEDLFPVMLKLPTYKISMRTVTIQSSSVLYPNGLKTLSKGLTNVEPGWIQTISALILSMVQSAVVRPEVKMNHIPPYGESGGDVTQPIEVVSGLTGSQAVSDLFVAHLLSRCSKKAEDGGASEFRPILANLLDDLLMVFLVPEYPAAEMLLMSLANRISREILELVNGNKTGENTYLNTILDTFGKICAAEARILKAHREQPMRLEPEPSCYCGQSREKQNVICCDRCKSQYHASCVGISASVNLDDWYCDACQMGRIVDFEKERNANMGESGCSSSLLDESYCMRRLLIDYLSITTRNSGTAGLQDAYEFQLARWLADISNKAVDSDKGIAPSHPTTSIWPLVTRLAELWDPRESSDLIALGQNSLNGMLHCLSDEGRSRIILHIASTQSKLLVSHRSQVGLFVNQLIGNKKNAMVRKLALKAIEKVRWGRVKLRVSSCFYTTAPLTS
jgi:PHD-finger